MSAPAGERLNGLLRRLRTASQVLDREVGEAHAIAAAGKALQVEIAELRTAIDLHERVGALLAGIGEARQSAVQLQIETLVTEGLRTIFGDGLSFHLVATTRAKTPVIDFVVRSRLGDQIVETDVMDARGGGLAAVVGFLLRLVVLLLSQDKGEQVLFLDETFAHVSVDYLPRVAEFVRLLVDKTGVQVVMVTHSDVFLDQADLRYRFELADGVTTAQAL